MGISKLPNGSLQPVGMVFGRAVKLKAIRSWRGHTAAFSLIELLVVMAIFALLVTAGSVAVGGRTGNKVRGGAEALHSLFGQARTHAVMKRTRARVVVQTEYRSDQPGDYLRRAAIFDETTPNVWTNQITPWVRLPEGVFFQEAKSGSDGTISIKGPDGEIGFDYYEFLSNGQRSGSARVVVEEGSLVDGTFTGRGDGTAHGFMIYPMGQRVFLSLEKIEEGLNP